MKNAMIIATLGLLSILATPTVAELCTNCAGKAFPEDTKLCPRCKEFATASGLFQLCSNCSKTLGKCERCCGNLAGTKLANTPLLDLTSADAGRVITAAVGQDILIRLGSDQVKGKNWVVESVKGTSIEQTGAMKPVYAGNKKNILVNEIKVIANKDTVEDTGTPTTHFVTFKAVKEGKTVILMHAKRRLGIAEADHELTFTIDVKTQDQITEISKIRLAKLVAANNLSISISYTGPAKGMISIQLTTAKINYKLGKNESFYGMTASKNQIKAVLGILAKTNWLGRASVGIGNPKAPSGQPTVTIRIADSSAGNLEFSSSAGWEPNYDLLPLLRAIDSVLVGKSGEAMLKMITRLAAIEKPSAQGIWGRVIKLSGNHMPGMINAGGGFGIGGGGAGGGTEYLSVPVHIFKGSVAVFEKHDPKHKSYLKTVKSDKNGRYVVGLAPGTYTIVSEIDGKLYFNGFSGGRPHSWSTVEVEAGKWTTRWDIVDSSDAAF